MVCGARNSLYNTDKKEKNTVDIARDVLSRKIDERWLLADYYYRVTGGVGFLFNAADLNDINVDLEALGLQDDTEKAIVYFSLMDALLRGRLLVLSRMKNHSKILARCDVMPLFNGQPYYYFKNFDFQEFDWIGYEKTEPYSSVRKKSEDHDIEMKLLRKRPWVGRRRAGSCNCLKFQAPR